MKRILILYLVILALLLAGCGTPSESTDTVSFAEPIESFDAESRVLVGEEGTDVPAEGFLVKEKKYVYFEKDVTILEVTNETQENYSVTVTGNYLDADGKVQKTETQTTEGFAAGYRKYYIFMPDMTFDSFSYTVSATPFDGVCYEQKIVPIFRPIRLSKGWAFDGNGEAIGHSQMYPVINCDIDFENQNDTDVIFVGTLLVFDNRDNLHYIRTLGMDGAEANGIGGQTVPIYYEVTDEEIDVPDYLTGDLKMIFTVDALFTDYEEADAWLASEGTALQKHRGKYGTPTKQS